MVRWSVAEGVEEGGKRVWKMSKSSSVLISPTSTT